MRKRMVSLLCALALCLGLLPVTALAAGENAPDTLYVGNISIPTQGSTTYLKADTTKGSLTTGSETDWTVKYEPSTATLTLKEATIDGGNFNNSVPYGAGIYAQCSSGQSVSLTIELIGENTIAGHYGIYVNASQESTIGTDASLLIKNGGDNGESGSLKVTGTGSYGICAISGTGNASLNIENAAVTSGTNASNCAGVSVQSGGDATSSPNLSLVVNGGSLTVSDGTSGDGMIQFYVGSPSADGATTSLTVRDNAIVRAENGIKADRVEKPTPSGTGIVFDGTEGTVCGNVTLDESLTINQGETLTIGKDASLTVPNDKTLTNNGKINVESGGDLEGTIGGKQPPTISKQPQSVTVTEGKQAAFEVSASAEGDTLTYQWQQSTDNGSNWTDIISGAQAASYAISSTTTGMDGNQYRCVVTSSAGSVTSAAATLTVSKPAPTIYTITADVTPAGVGTVTVNGSSTSASVTAGTSVTLIATPASGYHFVRWEENGAEVNTSATYTFAASGNRTLTAFFAQNSSGGSSGGSVTTYAATVPETAHGKVIVSPKNAAKGKTVTVTTTPDEGYELASLTVTDKDGSKVALTEEGNGKYTFEMPGSKVTVQAVFTEIETLPEPMPFTDVAETAWYADAVRYVYENGLMNGVSDTAFDPDGTMNRAMLVTILWRQAGEPVVNYLMSFTDVAQGQWYSEAIRWAVSEGIVTGTTETAFASDSPVTREQFATILYRYAQSEGQGFTGAWAFPLDYDDAGEVSEYAYEALCWMTMHGVIEGDGDKLNPQDSATRAEAAAMLMRFIQTVA